jgi:hypothetical protein
MTRTEWSVVIIVGAVAAILVLSFFDWFKEYQHIALWLEAVALILIFGLDYINRLDEAAEQERRHEETIEQIKLLKQEAEVASNNADAAKKTESGGIAPVTGLSVMPGRPFPYTFAVRSIRFGRPAGAILCLDEVAASLT